MKLYFNLNDNQFDTNLPEVMQIWLKQSIDLTDDTIPLLNKGLSLINNTPESIPTFIDYVLSEHCSDLVGLNPFEAIINILNNRVFSFSGTAEIEIGEYYAENFPELYDKYVENNKDFGERICSDMTMFGEWVLNYSGRVICEEFSNNTTYDYTDCVSYDTIEEIRSELSKF